MRSDSTETETETEGLKKRSDDANEGRKSGRKGGGEMGQTDGNLISGLKRNAPTPPHRRRDKERRGEQQGQHLG